MMLATSLAGLRKISLLPLSTSSTNPRQCPDTVVLKPEHTAEDCKQFAEPSSRVLLQQFWCEGQKCAFLINSPVMLMLPVQGALVRTMTLTASSLP